MPVSKFTPLRNLNVIKFWAVFNDAGLSEIIGGHLLIARQRIALLEKRNANCDTPAHEAAMNGHADCLDFLWEAGVNLMAVNKNGETPEDLARKNGHTNCLIVLRKAGATKECV